jgi:hypothetical protein
MAEAPFQSVRPYGVAIQQAIATGDVARMRQAEKQAETYVTEHGNVPAALAALKAEIARLEAKH